MSLYVLSITRHFLANTHSVAIFIQYVFDIFLSNRQVDFVLLDHPSVNYEKDGMQEPSPHYATVIHLHCVLFD